MKNKDCVCPKSRPLGSDHLPECPQYTGGTVTVIRNAVGAPVAVPEPIVLAAERPYRAWKAHQEGISWDQIAVDESFPTADAARLEVARYLREGRVLISDWTRREALAIENARLDALQALIWPQVKQGHLPAVNQARLIIGDRIKFNKLDEPTEEEGREGSRAPTVVVPADDDGFSRTLKEVTSGGG